MSIMKKKIVKIKNILVIIILIYSSLAYSQISDVGLFLSGGTKDAEKIMSAYLKPYTNAFGYNLNAGWYNTAKVHSLLGFDLTFTFNVAVVPTIDKTFDANSLGLSPSAKVSTQSIAQTIAGKTETGPEITYSANNNNLFSYNTPEGINWGYIPLPMAQLGLGLIKGTEVIGRFMPELKLGSAGKIGLWGIGLKHSIKQWIPAVDEIPFLNISVMGGYSKLHSVNNLTITPDMFIGVNDATSGKNIDLSNQQLDLMIKSFTFNALVSIDIPVLTIYAGLGISNTKTDLKMLGNYPIPNPLNYNTSLKKVDIVGNTSGNNKDIYKDPFNTTIKDGTKPRLNIGFKIKMGLIALHFDYTYANYSIATAGLGIGFR